MSRLWTLLCAVTLTVFGLAAPVSANEITPCQPGEANVGAIDSIGAKSDLRITVTASVRYCTPDTLGESFGIPGMVAYADGSTAVPEGGSFGTELGQRAVTVSFTIPASTQYLCLHVAEASTGCYTVEVRDAGTKGLVATLAPAQRGFSYYDSIYGPDPGCGNCW